MDRIPNFLRYGAPLASFAWSSAKKVYFLKLTTNWKKGTGYFPVLIFHDVAHDVFHTALGGQRKGDGHVIDDQVSRLLTLKVFLG